MRYPVNVDVNHIPASIPYQVWSHFGFCKYSIRLNSIQIKVQRDYIQILFKFLPLYMISSSFQTLPEINKDQLVSVG